MTATSSITILPSGNVGVGTTSPSRLLSVGSSGGISAYFAGNVGIGTDSPAGVGSNRLQITGSFPSINIESTGAAAKWGIRANWLVANDPTSAYLDFVEANAGGAARLVIKAGGNVGIGNTSPTYLLDVAGLGHFTGLVDAANFIATSTSATSTFLGGFSAGNNAAFVVNRAAAANSLYINPSGNVGIGTTTPSTPLEVLAPSSTNFNGVTISSNVSTPNHFGLNLKDDLGNKGSIMMKGSSSILANKLLFGNGASNYVFLDLATGNLGLSNGTPGAKLGVNGNVAIGYGDTTQTAPTNGLIVSGNVGIGTTNPGATFQIGTNTLSVSATTTNVGIGTTAPTNALNIVAADSPFSGTTGGLSVMSSAPKTINQGGVIRLGGGDSNYPSGYPLASIKAAWENSTASNYAGYLAFATGNGAGLNTEYMRITSAGNVGIGTTSPSALLSLGNGAGAAGTTAALGMNFGDPTANLYRSGAGTIKTDGGLLVAGNVGLGLAPAGAKLDISVASDANALRIMNGDLTSKGWLFYPHTNGSNTDMRMYEYSGASGDRVTFQSGGNVGIGTVAPVSIGSAVTTLTIAGKASDNAYSGGIALSSNDLTSVLSYIFAATTGLRIQNTKSTPIIFSTADTDRMRLSATGGLALGASYLATDPGAGNMIISGNVGIGSTTPWRTFSVTGTVALNGLTSSATGNALCITTTKDITDAGGASCVPSSIRFKENVETLDSGFALDELNKLRVVSFDYKPGFYSTEDSPGSYGLIAEEVADIDTKLVDYGYDGQPLTLKFEKLTGLAIQAIQELARTVKGFAESLVTKKVDTETLCLTDESGSSCYTRTELDALLHSTGNGSQTSNSGSGSLTSPIIITDVPPPQTEEPSTNEETVMEETRSDDTPLVEETIPTPDPAPETP